jgi:primary-amine oxidase
MLRSKGCIAALAAFALVAVSGLVVLYFAVEDVFAVPEHPLDALTYDEIVTAAAVLRDAGQADDKTAFLSVALWEMDKAAVRAWQTGDPMDRAARVLGVRGGKAFEAIVDLGVRRIRSWTELDRAALPPARADVEAAKRLVRGDPAWQAAMRARGYESFDSIDCNPFTPALVEPAAKGRPFRVTCYDTSGPLADTIPRPIEGLHALVDTDQGRVLEVVDTGSVPVPDHAALTASRARGDRPQLAAVSAGRHTEDGITLTGMLEAAWRAWSFHIRIDDRSGPVISLVRFKDGEHWRDIAYEMSLAEIFVPYMDPDPNWRYRAPLDAADLGLGVTASPLKPGGDCPQDAHFVPATFADESGEPYTIEKALCLFQRRRDLGWTGSRAGTELVVRSIFRLGNYDYVSDWVFADDGEIRMRIGATGIDMVKGVAADAMSDAGADLDTAYGSLVAPGLVAPLHDHYFGYRIDLDVDGPDNTLIRDRMSGRAGHPPEAVRSEGPVDLGPEDAALRLVNPQATPRTDGVAPGYQVLPGHGALSTLLADDGPQTRAAFSAHRLWLTAYKPRERFPDGDSPAADSAQGLPVYAADGDPVEDTDVVLWVTVGFNHLTRAEDWPILPTRWYGFAIRPFDFFAHNPAAADSTGAQ